jgi:glycosyltransferase involved in cell wall biosynthesis
VRGTAPATIAAALRRSLENARQRPAVAARARRMVERRYDWTRMLRQFDAIYRRGR